MPRARKTTAKPVAFPNRYIIEGDWYWENQYDTPNQANFLLTKEQVEEAIEDRATTYVNYPWGNTWDGDEEPSVYVLLDDGTFRRVKVDLPVTKATIRE